MKMNFTARQMKLFDVVRESIERKLARLEKFFADDAEMDVTFSLVGNSERIEITVRTPGFVFRAEEASDTFANSVDRAIDSLERQIRKNKTRLSRRVRSEGLTTIEQDLPDVEEEFTFNVRTKTFALKPMSVEEAILQMELVGHTFFVFKDSQSLETRVVYKRNNGGYGLIIPE